MIEDIVVDDGGRVVELMDERIIGEIHAGGHSNFKGLRITLVFVQFRTFLTNQNVVLHFLSNKIKNFYSSKSYRNPIYEVARKSNFGQYVRFSALRLGLES